VELKKSEKMMRKDISGGGFQKFRKKDEKRRFRRWISKIPKKKMRKDVSGGGFQKFRTNDEKRRFKRWRGQNLKNPKK
jgi:hypothetical protein